MDQNQSASNKKFFAFLKNYKGLIALSVGISLVINLLVLIMPRLISAVIDSFVEQTFDRNEALLKVGGVAAIILVLAIILTVLSNYTSERIAEDLRNQIAEKISKQSIAFINKISTSRLLTNLTGDVDAVKNFVSQGLVVVFASIFLLVGSIIAMLTINYKLAIPVILVIPTIIIYFGYLFGKISKYFIIAQQIIDKLNLVINESIVASPLVRVLNSYKSEIDKFQDINSKSKENGLRIVGLLSSLIPFINIAANGAVLIVLGYGGSLIIKGQLSFGDFNSFNLYIGTFIMPIFIIGFLGEVVIRAFTSYGRINEVLDSVEPEVKGTVEKEIKGDIELKDVNLVINGRNILKNISFKIKSGTRTAILGPTAAGKTQIFYAIAGLSNPDSGEIVIDGTNLEDYRLNSFYSQMGLVFQDSVIFNTSLRENIEFSDKSVPGTLDKAIQTAELDEFIHTLDNGLDTIITERGSNLSGGQKQRLTLARALAINPKILLLDDFTARVDINTEKRIFANLEKNYPNITLVAITQKIESVKDFDQIILIMEGELLAAGTHKELLEKSFEYKQIYESQQSTDNS